MGRRVKECVGQNEEALKDIGSIHTWSHCFEFTIQGDPHRLYWNSGENNLMPQSVRFGGIDVIIHFTNGNYLQVGDGYGYLDTSYSFVSGGGDCEFVNSRTGRKITLADAKAAQEKYDKKQKRNR